MEFELLGNICEVVRGSSPRPQGDKRYYGGKIPRLMIADVTRDKKYVTPIIDSLTEEGAAKSRPMKKGDLIIAVSGDPGRVCFLNVDACIHDGFVGLRNLDESKYDKEFLYYYLTFFKSSMKHRAYGAIFQNITTDILKGIKIPKLSISAQNNIAKLASKAENLIAQRKESIRILDEFLKSTFLEMFGDPTHNPKNWQAKRLDEISTRITDGKHGDCVDEANSGYYFLSAKDLNDGKLKYTDVREITQSDFLEVHKRTDLKLNDILLGNTGASIGKIGIVIDAEKASRTTFQKSISIITLKTDLAVPLYLKIYLSLNRKIFNKTSTGSAMTNLLLSQIRAFNILLPPIELQTQYAQIVEKTEALKTQYQQSLQELENLYGSLSQKAFRGELEYSEASLLNQSK
jgi:type I restriction enzyme, S subunit